MDELTKHAFNGLIRQRSAVLPFQIGQEIAFPLGRENGLAVPFLQGADVLDEAPALGQKFQQRAVQMIDALTQFFERCHNFSRQE